MAKPRERSLNRFNSWDFLQIAFFELERVDTVLSDEFDYVVVVLRRDVPGTERSDWKMIPPPLAAFSFVRTALRIPSGVAEAHTITSMSPQKAMRPGGMRPRGMRPRGTDRSGATVSYPGGRYAGASYQRDFFAVTL